MTTRPRPMPAPDPHTGGPSRFPLVTCREALARLRRFSPLPAERIAVAEAAGRVLARDVRTTLDLPHFARSYMDGYAVRARDTTRATAARPASLRVVGSVAMGHPVHQRLGPGEAMRIPTGGMLPAAADAVVMVEHTHETADGLVTIECAATPRQHVMRRGEDAKKGARVFARGHRVRPADVGALAGIGLSRVWVVRRPRVAVIATGDEIVPPDVTPGPGQVRNVNQYALRALITGQTSWPEFHAAFGPEGGCILDWPPTADAPSLSFVFQVRDAVRATQFVESLTGPSARGARWQRQEGAGITFFQAPEDRAGGTAPAVALRPEFVVLGAQGHAVRTVAERLRPGRADITQSAPFHEIMDRVKMPRTAFAYLDLRALFERSYGTLRPFLGMSLALSPETAPYFDASKLPSSEAFARHLGPSVYSQTSRQDGIFIESVGTLSLSQTLATLAAATWSSIGPAVGSLGKNAGRPPTPEDAKAAESSNNSENADETSQIRPFQR